MKFWKIQDDNVPFPRGYILNVQVPVVFVVFFWEKTLLQLLSTHCRPLDQPIGHGQKPHNRPRPQRKPSQQLHVLRGAGVDEPHVFTWRFLSLWSRDSHLV